MSLVSEDLSRSKSSQDKDRATLVKDLIEDWANDYPQFQYSQGMDLLAAVAIEGADSYYPKGKRFFCIFFFVIKEILIY